MTPGRSIVQALSASRRIGSSYFWGDRREKRLGSCGLGRRGRCGRLWLFGLRRLQPGFPCRCALAREVRRRQPGLDRSGALGRFGLLALPLEPALFLDRPLAVPLADRLLFLARYLCSPPEEARAA